MDLSYVYTTNGLVNRMPSNFIKRTWLKLEQSLQCDKWKLVQNQTRLYRLKPTTAWGFNDNHSSPLTETAWNLVYIFVMFSLLHIVSTAVNVLYPRFLVLIIPTGSHRSTIPSPHHSPLTIPWKNISLTALSPLTTKAWRTLHKLASILAATVLAATIDYHYKYKIVKHLYLHSHKYFTIIHFISTKGSKYGMGNIIVMENQMRLTYPYIYIYISMAMVEEN